MAKKAYIGIPEYTELAYIESTGTQYIDTGFYPNQDTRVVMTAQITDASATNQWFYGGGESTTPTKSFGAFWYNGYFGAYYGNAKNTSMFEQADPVMTVDIDQNRNVISFDESTYSFDEATFTSPSTIALLARRMGTSLGGYASAKLYSCQIYDSGVLVRDFVPCIRNDGAVGMYDRVSNTFFENKGTGKFVAGTAVIAFGDSVARKIKKMYVGVDNVARKIKKAYIGVGGVARPFLTGGELAYFGKATNLSEARYWFNATTVGNYALFGGGANAKSPINSTVVDAYNKYLTRSIPTALSTGRYGLTAVSVGGYGLFCGGLISSSDSSSCTSKTDAYDESLTRTIPTAMYGSYEAASVSFGEYAIIAGGSNYTKSLSTVVAYDKALTKSTLTSLDFISQALGATKLGNYALFAGGYYENGSGSYGYRNIVTVYNKSLTKSTAPNLSVARRSLAGTAAGRYAIFAGGESASYTYASNVDAYDTSLTQTTLDNLPKGRRYLGAATLGDYAMIGPGEGETNGDVDIYDSSLVRTSGTKFSTNKKQYGTTVVGDYALFGGGASGATTKIATVEVYTLK